MYQVVERKTQTIGRFDVVLDQIEDASQCDDPSVCGRGSDPGAERIPPCNWKMDV